MKTPQADETSRAYLATCLMPPANISRTILDMRRLVFTSSIHSGNALSPPVAALAVRRLKAPGPGTLKKSGLITLSNRMAEFWCRKIETDRTAFRSGAVYMAENAAYLELLSIPELVPDSHHVNGSESERMEDDHVDARPEQYRGIDFLLPGAGFFICRIGAVSKLPSPQPSSPASGAPSFLIPGTEIRFPEFGFRDCRIDVFHVETGGPEQEYSVWHQLATRRVHTGT